MAVRGWNPVDTKAYSDSALWLEFTLTAYLRETCDIDFLNEVVPFRDEGEATVLGHMDRALDFLESNKGVHDLLLIKFGDWNDSLTGVGKEGKGESVWLSIAYAQALLEMAELAKFLGNKEKEANYLSRREAITKAINDNAWDGDWYRRCYTDAGKPLGSKENKYAKMFMESQCWSLVSGVASEERANTVIKAMDEHMATPVGYMLLTPSFKEFDSTIGRISAMEPGICENGTIYSHTNIWMILGLLKYGKVDKAYELFKKIAPGYIIGDNADIKNKCLPYMFSNCYFGPEHKNSAFQMEYSWITGSVAWYTNTMENYLVGIRATYEGLVVDPHLPFDGAKMKRSFRGAEYEVSVSNPEKKAKDYTLEITVDGKAIEGNIIPAFDGGKHIVNVIVK
jgi:cellobiose phosphorylase